MKVIRRGCIPADKIWEGTCNICNSLIEAAQHELTNITHDQREGSFSWGKCPVCGNPNDTKNTVLFTEKKSYQNR